MTPAPAAGSSRSRRPTRLSRWVRTSSGEVEFGEAARGGAQLAHGGGGEHAVADDVPDEEADTGAGERDDVVPVSADVGFGGQIAVSDLHGVLDWQIVRQQAALEVRTMVRSRV